MKRFVTISVLIIPVMLAGCSHEAKPVQSDPMMVQAFLTRSVSAQVPQVIPLTGTVHAKETATISAQASGRIRAVLVRAGQRVRAGQLLVTLDSAVEQAGLQRATAAQQAVEQQQKIAATRASLATSTLARYRMLQQENSVSPQEFDEVQKRAQAAELGVHALDAESAEATAAIESARATLGYMQLRAPFSGVVTARLADPGTLAVPSMPLLQMDRDGPLQVYAKVDESLLSAVHLGLTLPVEVDAAGVGAIAGRVAEILPAADPSSHTFLLKIDLPTNPAWHAGMYATAQLLAAKRSVILVPQSAIVQRGSLNYVYALGANGVAQLRYVTLGRTQGGNIVVLSGLEVGEQLVENPGDCDLAGKRIEAGQ